MIIVNMHEAKTKLSSLLQMIEKGHEIVRICRDGKPIADLVPIRHHADQMKKHKELQGIIINYDPTAPLSEEEWLADNQAALEVSIQERSQKIKHASLPVREESMKINKEFSEIEYDPED